MMRAILFIIGVLASIYAFLQLLTLMGLCGPQYSGFWRPTAIAANIATIAFGLLVALVCFKKALGLSSED